jgi:hypothetical protein
VEVLVKLPTLQQAMVVLVEAWAVMVDQEEQELVVKVGMVEQQIVHHLQQVAVVQVQLEAMLEHLAQAVLVEQV